MKVRIQTLRDGKLVNFPGPWRIGAAEYPVVNGRADLPESPLFRALLDAYR